MTPDEALARLVRFFEAIGAATVRAEVGVIYAADARFKDPFNEVSGQEAIAQIFEHMFEQVDEPRFTVTGTVLQGNQAFLTWDFQFAMKRFAREPQCIKGATHIVFDDRGAVALHRDYWDAAEELYEKIPVLGALMRWLKRTASR